MSMSVVMCDFLLTPKKMDGSPKKSLDGKCFGGNLGTLRALAERGLLDAIEQEVEIIRKSNGESYRNFLCWSYEYTDDGKELVKGLQNPAVYMYLPGRYPTETRERIPHDYVWPFIHTRVWDIHVEERE